MDRVRITHFSDLLCVWAYVSQIRCDELVEAFASRVSIDTRFLHVFGDVTGKIETAWASRGGIDAYAKHVREVVEGFDHVELHPRVWTLNTPTSSMPAHLLLCAIRLLERAGEVEEGTSVKTAWALREAFFARCEDISDGTVLLEVAGTCSANVEGIATVLGDGRAHAALAGDLEQAREQMIRASPTLVFNEGRQRLTGNVGYRIIEANVRELLEQSADQQSWC
ncbi:MAG: DsbA family protein [Deltaproteobacteria bacterium]|nr:DsbA family protein [Deltaproteobacteria bacterium]